MLPAPIAKWTAQGKSVTYVMVSRGEAGINELHPSEVGPLRSQEEIDAARVVGVDTVEFLEHQDGVIEYGLPLRRDISRAIRRYRPDVLLTLSHHLQFPSGHLKHGRPPQRGRGRVRCRPGRRQPLDLPRVADAGAGTVGRGAVRGRSSDPAARPTAST